jgi:hypothetical protein
MPCSTVLPARNDNYVSDLRLFDEPLCWLFLNFSRKVFIGCDGPFESFERKSTLWLLMSGWLMVQCAISTNIGNKLNPRSVKLYIFLCE